MSDADPTADLTRCPSCGVLMDSSKAGGACPACLMSGVLRVEAETAPIDSGVTPDQLGQPAIAEGRAWPVPHLPGDFGGYTLVASLGRGGMGTVFEAVERSTGRRLALKLLAQSLDSSEMRQRFMREGRLAARVNHPSSLYVFGSEEIDGVPVITMEIAAGGTLQDALHRRGPLPVAEAVDAILNVIDGLEAALQRGVLHRDIKPSNCFVSPDGTVKVGDFGLSVSTLPSSDSFVTQTGKVMGTPAFASPEQLRGDEVDARSDIYSVGATLFTLLTDRAPFEGDNAVQVVANVIDTAPADASGLREEIPAGLSRVIARCLAKEPSGRFTDYASLRNALLPFSSAVPEPATQSQRGAAGWVDYLAAFLPTYAAMMITVGPERLLIRPLYEFSLQAWSYHLTVLAVGFLYFTLAEGIWGSGLGKWITGIRVVRTSGKPIGPVRALARICVPFAAIEALRIPLSVAALPSGEWAPMHIIMNIGLATACPWVVALLWLTAKKSNGNATVWDLVTGTKVVVQPRGHRHVDTAPLVDSDSDTPSDRCIGPFAVSAEIEPEAWLAGMDPVLRRLVWLIHGRAGGVSEPRRAVARPGRVRWLQSAEQDGDAWEVYEAPRGRPLAEIAASGPVAWATMRHWLHDLAAEMRAAERDGTLAAEYSIASVWITDDGRAMLLDDAWPGAADASQTIAVTDLDGQQRFLGAILKALDPLSVPLHARPAVDNLRARSFEKLTFLTGTLRGLLNKPADVGRGVRGASLLVIPGYAWIATMLGIAGNAQPADGLVEWIGRAVVAALVMMHFIAFFDVVLAFWKKSTGLSTFGLEAVTERGRASRGRMLWRSALMWAPVVMPTAVLGALAWARGEWIRFDHAVVIGAIAIAGAAVFVGSALVKPTRGLHDRLAGVWIGRR